MEIATNRLATSVYGGGGLTISNNWLFSYVNICDVYKKYIQENKMLILNLTNIG